MKKTQLRNIIREAIQEAMGTSGAQINQANTKTVIERNSQYASTSEGGMYDVCVLTNDKKAHFGYMAKFGDEWDYESFQPLKGNSNNGNQYFGADEIESVEQTSPGKVRIHIKNEEGVDLYIEGSAQNPDDVKDDNKAINFKVEKTGWSPNKKTVTPQPEAPEPGTPMNENTIKKSRLKQLIREAIMEMNAEMEDHDETDLSDPEEKKEVQIGREIQALVYQLLAMHGVVDGEEEKEDGEDTEQEDSEPIAEADEEADADNPAENEEIEIAKKIKNLANELLSMHGITDDGEDSEEDSEPINEKRKSKNRR
jgi:hypothetical protein